MQSITRSEKTTTTPKGAGVKKRTVSAVRQVGGWWRRFLISAATAVPLFVNITAKAQIIGLDPEAFYHPGDSTVYLSRPEVFNPYEGNEGSLIFRLKNLGRTIERSPFFLDSIGIDFATHDNMAGHFYVIWEFGAPSRNLETSNGGDSWKSTNLPVDSFLGGLLGAPGENPGESFLVGRINRDSLGYGGTDVLYSTTDSWQTWDTNYVMDNWNSHDFFVCFGQRNGQLIRIDRDDEDKLDFSSDTGLTWVPGYVNEPLPGHYTVAGTGTEIYRWTSYRAELFYCVRDSGRDVSTVFDATDYYDYDYMDPGGYMWGHGYFITTRVPGEFYVVEDSAYWDDYGIKLHIYHVTNYGENVEIYYYNMPNYEVCEPEGVFIDIHPVPKDAAFLIYPNPCNSDFKAEFSAIFLPVTIELYDIAGRRLYSNAINPSRGRSAFIWDSRNHLSLSLPSGNYFIRLQYGTNQAVRNISVQK